MKTEVKLFNPTDVECAECKAIERLWNIDCKDFPAYEDLAGKVTLCVPCLRYDGHPPYYFIATEVAFSGGSVPAGERRFDLEEVDPE